jgi:hypothetical protein
MKTIFSLLICLFSYLTMTAQGISVQGIARDAQKAALVDKRLTFTFDIKGQVNGTVTSFYKENVDITTDPYGVFSHIIGIDPDKVVGPSGKFIDIPFGQTHMKLVISVGNNVISDAPFQYTPYAKSADYAKSAENGVPTGTIVAFAGVEGNLPAGWTLCDGRPLNTVTGSANLIALIGANAPDLQGMFLRGTGTSPINNQAGPALRGTQDDAIKSHDSAGSTTSNGDHKHDHEDRHHFDGAANDTDFSVPPGGGGGGNFIGKYPTDFAGLHTHDVDVSYSGGAETRPVNYGVNYIIKL